MAEVLNGGTKIFYAYKQDGWKDQLMAYNKENFTYDKLGNPATYRNKTLSWSHGRQLDNFGTFAYKYNANGIRTSKVVNGIETRFYLSGNKIMAQDNGSMLQFHYGADGLAGFTFQGIGEYFYKKNIQGDIISIYDKNGIEIVKYAYDAWGTHKTYVLNSGEFVDISGNTNYTTSGNNNKLIAELNPFRYRSYYYDSETKFYYLNSRYYDPETGRFINADDVSVLYATKDYTNGLNLYAYCFNDPVNAVDHGGDMPNWLKWVTGIAIAVGVILVIGAITVLTMGVGTTIMATTMAGAVLHGAAVGALIGAGVGVVAGGIIGGAVSGWSAEGILTGMAIGFGAGALIGAVIGGTTGAIQYTHAVSQWGSTSKLTSQQNMVSHFNKHVVSEGHKYLGKNVIQYTKNAKTFFNANQGIMKLTSSGNYAIRALFEGVKAGGFFSKAGIIFSFF